MGSKQHGEDPFIFVRIQVNINKLLRCVTTAHSLETGQRPALYKVTEGCLCLMLAGKNPLFFLNNLYMYAHEHKQFQNYLFVLYTETSH